jgi:drug/metabolite transporter (DMT)-like permease
MDVFVFTAVLAAAAFHAGWNALLKLNLEPYVSTTLVAAASGVVALPFAIIVGLPSPAAWPYILASVAIHIVYYLSLAQAYRFGDLGQVYPIARGTAPLMTAVVASNWLGETLGPYGWAGVVVLAAGILLLAVRGGSTSKLFNPYSVGFALLNALTITTYTLVDGLGARVSAAPSQYTVWLFLLSGATMGAWGVARLGARRLATDFAGHWRLTVGAAVLSTAAYGIAIWAMTVAPIALVAALRESSVLFAALLAAVVLREPVLPTRIAAALLVLVGMLLVRLR